MTLQGMFFCNDDQEKHAGTLYMGSLVKMNGTT